jgi:molecular chaperone GrpE (heat shock protein)
VTDLVSGQEEIKKEVEADKDMLSKNTEQLDSLLNKLEDLENQLGSMDTMVTQIEKLEQKIEKIRPKTQEEKLEARKYDSGPFSQSLVDFYEDNEDRFEKSGKDEYVLTGKDLENYNQSDIKQSFNVD